MPLELTVKSLTGSSHDLRLDDDVKLRGLREAVAAAASGKCACVCQTPVYGRVITATYDVHSASLAAAALAS